MTLFLIFLYITYLASSITQGESDENTLQQCIGQQANYDLNNILGSWFVVALIPETGFPKLKKISCYEMDISEIDEAGLRWLVSRKFESPSQELIDRIKGTIIRKRYYSEKPFDIWSKAIPGANGCYKQLFSLETNNTRIADAEELGTSMQLHILEPSDGTGPYLIQILWGRLISAVIYRRTEGITSDRLSQIHDFLTNMRGYQRPPRMCEKPTKEIVAPPFQRPQK